MYFGCVLKYGNLKRLSPLNLCSMRTYIFLLGYLIYKSMKCLKCGLEKEPREFQENEFLTRGRVDNCFDCESVYINFLMQENQRNESRANVLQLEKDKANEYRKTYRHKNKDVINEKARLYRQANKLPKVLDPKEFTYRDVIDKYKEDRRTN